MTKREKMIVTEDWRKEFPSLSVYKPMHLLNRIGPLLVGIYLKKYSFNESYLPIFHVHNLLRDFPSISLQLYNSFNRSIRYPLHKVEYLEYIKKFKEKILIPLEGDVTLKRIFKGFCDYMINTLHDLTALLNIPKPTQLHISL